MNKVLIRIISSILLLLFTSASQAYIGLCCAKCGGNMPMNIPGGGIPETKEFRFKLSPMFMRMNGLQQDGDNISVDSILGMPAMDKYMAAPTAMDMKMLNFTLGYSFTDRFFGGMMLMYKDSSMDMKFNSNMAMMTGQSGYTMESSGIADTMLMSKYRLTADDPLAPTRQSSLFFGVSMPTGSIDERNSNHPVPMRQSELLPYGMQLGSGTVDPTIGYLYQGSSSPYWWGVNSMYTARLYDNNRDYRFGNELRIDAYGMYQFAPDMLVQYQLNIRDQQRISGEMDVSASGDSGHAVKGDAASPYMTPLWDPNNYGGRSAVATVGFQWQPAPLHIIDVNVGIPVYQKLNGIQMEESYQVMLTWYMEIPTKGSIRHPDYRPQGSKLGF